jgi:hypothetical protein
VPKKYKRKMKWRELIAAHAMPEEPSYMIITNNRLSHTHSLSLSLSLSIERDK